MRGAEYTFDSPLNYGDVSSALKAAFPGRWSEGDSAWYGDYLGFGLQFNDHDKGVIRIYSANKLILKLKLHCDDTSRTCAESWQRLHDFAMNEIIPVTKATTLRPSDEID